MNVNAKKCEGMQRYGVREGSNDAAPKIGLVVREADPNGRLAPWLLYLIQVDSRPSASEQRRSSREGSGQK